VGHKCRDFVFFGPPELYDKYVPGQYYNQNPYGNKDVAYISTTDRGSEIAAMSSAAMIIAARCAGRLCTRLLIPALRCSSLLCPARSCSLLFVAACPCTALRAPGSCLWDMPRRP
jgi:hypothetical protein